MSRQFLPHKIRVDYDGTRLDEIVASDAHVHLEQMSDNYYALIIETATERAIIHVGAKNQSGHVSASVFEHEPVNRRSEAQKRRWNSLTPVQRKRRKR